MAEDNSPATPMNESTGAQGESRQQEGAVIFATRRIYVKDLSFESPLGHEALGRQNGQPKVSQDLNTQIDRINENLFEVVLKLTVTLKFPDDKTAFLAEVHQAGLFEVKGVPPQQMQHLLTASCPQILFPYVRETVDMLAVKGGFAPLYIPHINFDVLYAQALKESKAKAEAEQTDKTS